MGEDVANSEVGIGGVAAWSDGGNIEAIWQFVAGHGARGGHVAFDAERDSLVVFAADQFFEHWGDDGHWDGKAHAFDAGFVRVISGVFNRVDTDDFTLAVEQGAAAVAAVDGSVGLDHVLYVRIGGYFPVKGANYADRDGLAVAEGVADGDHAVADFECIAVAGGGDFDFCQSFGADGFFANRDDGDVAAF